LALAAFVAIMFPGVGIGAEAGSQKFLELLAKPAAERAFWGIKIVDLDSGLTVFDHNPDKLFVPASNAKLFSTAVALSRLGSENIFTTAIVIDGKVSEQGVLTGNLVLRGGGDPDFSARIVPYQPKNEFAADRLKPIKALVEQVLATGIKKIDGDILGDDSRYVWQPYGVGWSIDDGDYGYGAPVSALTLNDNVIDLTVLPGLAAHQPARLEFDPKTPYFDVNNLLTTAATRTVARNLAFDLDPRQRIVHLWGEISVRSGGRRLSLPVDDPALFAAIALRDELVERGVTITGAARPVHLYPFSVPNLLQAAAPRPEDPRTVIARLDSQPLPEAVRVVNKVSQNLHAEMLLREVGFKMRGVGSREAGQQELRTFLREAGLKPAEFFLRDASGLSRHDLVSPAGTVQLLRHMWQSELRKPYVDSLPLAGEDGTLDWRFSKSAARGKIRAKTGTLTHVTALSGYAFTDDGRNLAFSILVNNFGAPTSYIRSVVDEICLEMLMPLPALASPSQSRSGSTGTVSSAR
jgi:D-alanyl-D-alanine carboxypeptidase/D-alanyl-D-alanine-endopeptidase (penicillin-binding protein 4)